MRLFSIFAFLLLTQFCMPALCYSRSIYLNGKDVSSATGKKLEGVNISIADNGDVYISAPQYQVLEEVSYIPLGQDRKETAVSKRDDQASRMSTNDLPEAPASNLSEPGKPRLDEKPGTKTSR